MPETVDNPPTPERPNQKPPESWHFDALSDDGREAVVITFNDNYPFSPRAFRAARDTGGKCPATFPAVTLSYAADGKILLRAVNEFDSSLYSVDPDGTWCSIGASAFRRNSTDYGSGFVLHLELLTPRKCRLEAEFEWLSIETADTACQEHLLRTIVAPRSDVSGRITRIGRKGRTQSLFHFRGTGYHDRVSTFGAGDGLRTSSLVGRAHFVDSTSAFQSFHPVGGLDVASSLVLVKDGGTIVTDAKMDTQNFRRDRYGLIYPGRISFAGQNLRVHIKPIEPIESGFFKKIMTSEVTLMLGDEEPRKTIGIVEFTEPMRLRNRVFRWLSALRIGRDGRAPIA